ncbi:hypothetical protein [Kutzneria kofuensis]|uniref:Uncharacterized protein n=1 Tax=Kutzneria kofuensis TaxID=103725 RepID=A0A7W9KQP7_9PSEU|nr:hypothetical protein [Kutzneria kofuensis]MBB5896971.1 hypothetical protein [Kutzneria kofuensis]
MDYTYCKVFLKGPAPAKLPSAPGVDVEKRSNQNATGPWAQQWRRERSAVEYVDPDDDFLLWPTIVELYADEEPAQRAIVRVTAELLRRSWDAGVPAVAACDFEDELPWSGGVDRLAKR